MEMQRGRGGTVSEVCVYAWSVHVCVCVCVCVCMCTSRSSLNITEMINYEQLS